MNSYLKPCGTMDIFVNSIGSYFSNSDLCTILSSNIPDIKKYLSPGLTDENSIHKIITSNKLSRNKETFDELVINYILNKLGHNTILQYKLNKYKIDIYLPDKSIGIEFLGPSHFCVTRYGIPKNPIERSMRIEDKFGIQIINWPFWMPKISKNVESVLNNTKCIFSMWNSNILYSDFYFDNSDELIKKINSQFKNINPLSIGYMYEKNIYGYIKPEHPIINKIRVNSDNLVKLLPKKSSDITYYIPEEFLK